MRRAALLLAAAAVALLALRPAAAVPFGPPSASMTWSPGTPMPSVTVTFTIDAFDPDGPLTSGSLEYGDGTKESFLFTRSTTRDAAACVTGDKQKASLRHVYAGRGDYPVKLTVDAGSCPGANLVVAGRVVASYMVSVGAPNTKPAAGE
jgi:hypothetical protein